MEKNTNEDLSYFFFQAEDGIRDTSVTGVQTCALPICRGSASTSSRPAVRLKYSWSKARLRSATTHQQPFAPARASPHHSRLPRPCAGAHRSEERRVGKECRCRCAP